MDDLYLEMPRGTVLQDGDCLGGAEHDQVLKILAKPEPVITVQALEGGQLSLLKAAYHLGNRHVMLEIGVNYLRLAQDSVLESMLHQLGVAVTRDTVPFQPEAGAYGHNH